MLLVYAVFLFVVQAVLLAPALLHGQELRPVLIAFPTLLLATLTTSLVSLVACLVYNLIARWTGGIKVDVHESGPEGAP